MSSPLSVLDQYRCIILCGESGEAVARFGCHLQSSLPEYEVVPEETFGDSLIDFNAVFKSLGRRMGRKIICASSMSHVLHRVVQPSAVTIWVKSDISSRPRSRTETNAEQETLQREYSAAGLLVVGSQSIRSRAWTQQKALLMLPHIEVFFLSKLGTTHVLETSKGTPFSKQIAQSEPFSK
jgi:hypothetical protein